LAKLANLSAVVDLLTSSTGLRLSTARIIVMTLPVVEILLAILMVAASSPWINGITAILFVTFALYIAALRILKPSAKCGCFGGQGRVGWHMVVRNVGFTALSAAGLASGQENGFVLAGMTLIVVSAVAAGPRHPNFAPSRTP
jgi:hypothetical protein